MTITVIIPTIAGREESYERCVKSYREGTPGADILTVHGEDTCGAGWAKGLQEMRSATEYVLLACDDQQFIGEPDWTEKATKLCDAGLLPCPRVWLPDGRIESQGGDMDAFCHVIARPQRDGTPVDYTVIPFMSAEQAEQIGMLPELHYCSDVWVSYRGRQLGFETVLCHGFDVMHWHEQVGRGAGMSVPERDAMDEKTMRKALEECESSSPAR